MRIKEITTTYVVVTTLTAVAPSMIYKKGVKYNAYTLYNLIHISFQTER
jgi:hypothetical protein